jgi:hypothetical protein
MNASPLAIVLCASLLLAACSREKLGAPAAGTHRRAAKAIAYSLDSGATDELELGVREAFQLWSDASAFKFTYAGKSGAGIGRDGRNQVVFAKKWPSELPIGEAAWCQVYLDKGGSIAEADILLNAQAFSFTTRREAKPGSIYVEDLLAREIGRSLGLGLGEDSSDRYKAAAPGDGFEPGIDPAEMAAYLSLYAAAD